MLYECQENEDYVKVASSKDEFFSTESLFIVLILQQQKMISQLIANCQNIKNNKTANIHMKIENG
jgi:hypothetical protein